MDNLIMRLTDIFFAIPSLLFLIVVVSILDSSATTIFVALGIISWPSEARLMRSEVLRLRGREFVTAAQALGVPSALVIFRHILPNAMASMIVCGVARGGGGDSERGDALIPGSGDSAARTELGHDDQSGPRVLSLPPGGTPSFRG